MNITVCDGNRDNCQCALCIQTQLRRERDEAVALLRDRPRYYPLAGKALAPTYECAKWDTECTDLLARLDAPKGGQS